MSKLNMAFEIWLAINVAILVVMLSRRRRPHMVRRVYHCVAGTESEARKPYAHALVLASHHRR
jgi:hypothetical protein